MDHPDTMGTTEQIHHDIYVTSTVFAQVQNRINKNTAGLGLNLYIISYHIISYHIISYHVSVNYFTRVLGMQH